MGETIWVGSEFYVVIGQTKPRVASAAIGGSLEAREYNLDAYIPLETLRHRVGDLVMKRVGGEFQGERVELSQITVSVDSVDDVDETAAIITTLLKKYHENEDYAVVVPKELLQQAERTRAMFNVLLVVIAGISLLVGGIGIMNIMFVSVTERTKEIGIRKAIGAKRRTILIQFLVEAAALCLIGGLIGLAIAFPLSLIVDQFLPTAMPLSVVFISIVISLVVGVISGFLPAYRAARMDPVEALRYE
jgi:putative ABC transport system permease protein